MFPHSGTSSTLHVRPKPPEPPQPRVYTSTWLSRAGAQPQLIHQFYFAEQLGWWAVPWCVLLVFRLYNGQELLWAGLLGAATVVVGAWLLSRARMQQLPATLEFSGDGFRLRTVSQVAYTRPAEPWFPLVYARPHFDGTSLQLHYHDRILALQAKHWPEMDTILAEFRHP